MNSSKVLIEYGFAKSIDIIEKMISQYKLSQMSLSRVGDRSYELDCMIEALEQSVIEIKTHVRNNQNV
jgi:hypothetical protein